MRAIRDHGSCHGSDAAKEQLSSGQCFLRLVQAKALPISNDPTGCAAEQRLRQRGRSLGTWQLVAGSGPGGPAPTWKGASVLRHRCVGSPPSGGIYAM